MRPRAPLAGLLLLAALGVASCSLATSSCQYQAEGACNFCSEPTLRHAPCPTGGLADDTASPSSWYVLRALDLGANPARWDAGTFQGLDLDCSNRPDASPVLCRAPGSFNSQLPEGIDNTLAVDTFLRVANGRSIGETLEQGMNAEIERGKWGAMLVVDGWNGRPDDDTVDVRLLYTYGSPTRTQPRWDGTDTWSAPLEPDGRLPSSDLAGGTAYVTGGRLVWDRRDQNEVAAVRLEFNAEVDSPYNRAELALFDFTLVGALTPESAEVTVSGAWSASNASLYPSFLAGGERVRECEIRRLSGSLRRNDLPSPPFKRVCGTKADEQDCTQSCGSTSVGLGMRFVATDRAHVEGDNKRPPPKPQPTPNTLDCPLDGGQ